MRHETGALEVTRWMVAATCACLGVTACGTGGPGGGPIGSDPADMRAEEMGPPEVDEDMGPDAAPEVAPEIVRPRFEPAAEDDFYRMPWPMDARTEGGAIDISDFPEATQVLFKVIRRELETIEGFATMPVIYVSVDRELPLDELTDPAGSLEPEAGLQLLELGEGCGQRVPLQIDQDVEGGKFVDPLTLRVGVVPGFVLAPKTTYAMVMRRELGPGWRAERPDGFAEALAGDGPLSQSLTPLTECLDRLDGLGIEDVAVAAVFTTQNTVSSMQRLAEAVRDPERVQEPNILELERDEAAEDEELGRNTGLMRVYTGAVEMPIFQEGNSPYASSGGSIDLDDQGRPVVQRYEEVPFSLAVPEDAAPGDELPVVVYAGGTWQVHKGHLPFEIVGELVRQGYAVANFVPQFHSPRAEYTDEQIVTYTFNYLNPASGRSVFRQQAAEAIYFVRVLGALSGRDQLPRLDVERPMYLGHSQGSLAGALVAATSDDYIAYGFNGLGSYTSVTVVERKDIMDIERLVRDVVGAERPLDIFHPVIQFVQAGVEIIDPHNYSPYWSGGLGHDGVNVFVTNGGEDSTSPRKGITSVTVAGDLQLVNPDAAQGWGYDPYDLWPIEGQPAPLGPNRERADESTFLHGTYMITNNGHFSLFRDPIAGNFMLTFLLSSYEGDPIVELR